MHQVLIDLCESLEDLDSFLKKYPINDSTFKERYGWSAPVISTQDVALLPIDVAKRIRSIDIDSVDDELIRIFESIPNRIESLKRDTLPNIFSTNNNQNQAQISLQALSSYLNFILWLELKIQPLFSWQHLEKSSMPPQLAKTLRSTKTELEQIMFDQKKLASQIQIINEAVETAETLPIDLQKLKEARKTITDIKDDVKESEKIIKNNSNTSSEFLEKIFSYEKQSKQLVDKCEEAYRITATKGLAAAFEKRAGELKISVGIWTLCLLIGLLAGGYIGQERIQALSETINQPTINWAAAFISIVLSVLSIGAPLWFAWLSTKQVTQSFKLAEDYSFKASLAKAYEGYSKEAARLDPVFEARLFASALARLDENPLRLMSTDMHNSPWQELFASQSFQKAFDTVPEFKNDFINLIKDKLPNFNSPKSKPSEIEENKKDS